MNGEACACDQSLALAAELAEVKAQWVSVAATCAEFEQGLRETIADRDAVMLERDALKAERDQLLVRVSNLEWMRDNLRARLEHAQNSHVTPAQASADPAVDGRAIVLAAGVPSDSRTYTAEDVNRLAKLSYEADYIGAWENCPVAGRNAVRLGVYAVLADLGFQPLPEAAAGSEGALGTDPQTGNGASETPRPAAAPGPSFGGEFG